jgi:hypothetical protein
MSRRVTLKVFKEIFMPMSGFFFRVTEIRVPKFRWYVLSPFSKCKFVKRFKKLTFNSVSVVKVAFNKHHGF